ncbi:heterokaryon incompatibility protein-domain-containing protein [Exophiala viscosa]|uniref:heterokaryon incompatibility protein-domain-containing protein n=1 Tax=Exophiala viscosa TaxID=2486360 RepID=UPI00219301C5|nr:heterokaryon incompatibility protein-domain-containing protein [Exophiala viscosa]
MAASFIDASHGLFESPKPYLGATSPQLTLRTLKYSRDHLSTLETDCAALCPRGPLEDRARYRYVRLQSPEQIRILELLPAQEPDSRLCFKVYYADLEDLQVAYTAISYAWGERDPDGDRLIECDGLRAYIQPSLHSALVRIRKRKPISQFIWADALCIDQVDKDATQTVQDVADSEKSHQVSIMDRIFSHADQVIIDLGEGYDALSTLDKYCRISQDLWSSVNVAAGTSTVENSIRTLKQWRLPTTSSPFWDSFRHFMYRPWFTRAWVIQEYALARSPVFMIGTHFRDQAFLPDGVARAAQHLEILYLHQSLYQGKKKLNGPIAEAYFYVAEKHKAVHQIYDARSSMSDQRTFCELLDAATLYFNTTNSCDKAYALLGLSSDKNIKQDLYVDYSEDEQHLSLRVSQYLCRRGFDIYPLYHCLGDVDHKYASWGINLTNTREGLANTIGPSGHTRRSVFNACGAANFVRKLSDLRADGLTVRGWVIDTIEKFMSKSIPHDEKLVTQSDVEDQSVWQGYALDWMFQVATLQPLKEDEFIKCCWRTMIADLAMPGVGVGQGFRRLREWAHAERCINTVDKVVRIAHKKWKGILPKSQKIYLSGTELNDLHIHGESWVHALGRKLALGQHRKTPCLVPHSARKHDKIVIIQGCEIPFILRAYKDEKGEYFRIVGCAYVHGIMDGEAVGDGSHCRDIEIR